MSTIKYSEEHEWVEVDGDTGTVGISNYAQEQLGDIVFIELPEAGATVEKGAEVAVVESVKAASEIYSPVSGDIVESNAALSETPELVNSDAEGGGWLYKVKLADAGELDTLMDADGYAEFVEGLG
jgi:glycine cleavage system H protein